MQFFCTYGKKLSKVRVKELTFSNVAGIQPVAILKNKLLCM